MKILLYLNKLIQKHILLSTKLRYIIILHPNADTKILY